MLRDRILKDDMFRDTISKIKKVILIVVLIISVFLYVCRPFFHGFFMRCYTNPAFLLAFVALGAGIMIRLFSDRFKWTIVVGAIFFVALLVGSMFVAEGKRVEIYKDISSNIVEIDTFPESTSIRLMPYQIARNNMTNNLTLEQFRLGKLDFVILDGEMWWNAALIPDGTWIHYRMKPYGAMFINACETETEIIKIKQDLEVAEGIGISDNIYWRLYKDIDYWSDYSDPFYIPYDNNTKIMTVVSKIDYKLDSWTFVPLRKPVFGGVVLIDGEGNMKYVSPEKIDEEPILHGQQVFPEAIARLYGESFAYKRGVWNAWIAHKDQTELNDVPGEGNFMPYLIMVQDENGEPIPMWFMALEPYGTTYGLKKVLLVDAIDGTVYSWSKGENEQSVGAVKSIEHAKSTDTFRNVNWADFRLIEPIPIFKEGTMYWKLTMTRYTQTGITNIVLIEASNPENVIVFKDGAEFQQFLTEGATDTVKMSMDQLLHEIDVLLQKIKDLPSDAKSPILVELEEKLERLLSLLEES